jgi:glyoxylase-like metal-dependent hydrolase (beta-lactamase superfamily II)
MRILYPAISTSHENQARQSSTVLPATTDFEKHEATDGEQFAIGKLKIEVLHTPGHTPESTSYLLYDESGKPYAPLFRDTLFIGDVGRPDLAQKATGLTQEDLAGWLYDSLRKKINDAARWRSSFILHMAPAQPAAKT